MKRNTTLTLMMMLCSVAAAVAAPETPSHETVVDCIEHRQIAAVDPFKAAPQRVAAVPTVSRRSVDERQAGVCEEDITAPYRRLHHGGMKLPAGCAEAT